MHVRLDRRQLWQSGLFHLVPPHYMVVENHPICHMEAVNTVLPLGSGCIFLQGCLVLLHTDNNTAVAIFKVGRGRDSYRQACSRELWLICGHADITLAISHVSDESLTQMADAVNGYHMVQASKSQVHPLVNQGVQLVNPAHNPFQLSDDLYLVSFYL